MTEITAHHGLFRTTKLHVDDTGGSGRPVVLIHGWPLSGESWAAQVPALVQAGYRVITYDRRGFGRSDKGPVHAYSYDTLAGDLAALLDELDLTEVTLVGFSMGGGEVARYVAAHGAGRVRSVVFASAVTPYLMRTPGNPDGPLGAAQAAAMAARLTADQDSFYDGFVTDFFSVDGRLAVTEQQRQDALAQCAQADKKAALACLAAFGNTDFRDDLTAVKVPTLVLHGDSDATVPFEGSGARTHEAIPGSRLRVLRGAPHGCTVSHADEWNAALLDFLGSDGEESAPHDEAVTARRPEPVEPGAYTQPAQAARPQSDFEADTESQADLARGEQPHSAPVGGGSSPVPADPTPAEQHPADTDAAAHDEGPGLDASHAGVDVPPDQRSQPGDAVPTTH